MAAARAVVDLSQKPRTENIRWLLLAVVGVARRRTRGPRVESRGTTGKAHGRPVAVPLSRRGHANLPCKFSPTVEPHRGNLGQPALNRVIIGCERNLVLSHARSNEYDSFERLLKIVLVNVYFVRKNLSKSVTMVGRNRGKSHM